MDATSFPAMLNQEENINITNKCTTSRFVCNIKIS